MSAVAARVTLDRGRLEIAWPGFASTGALRARVLQTDGHELVGERWRRSGDLYVGRCGSIQVALAVKVRGARVRLEVSATATAGADVAEVGLACTPVIGGRPPGWIVHSGYQSWDASGVAPAEHGGEPVMRHSWWTCGLASEGGAGIAASATGGHRTTTRFDLLEGRLVVTGSEPSGLIRHPLMWRARRGGRGWRGDAVVLAAGPDVRAALRKVASAVRGRPAPPPPVGWLSWYHFGPWIGRDEFLANSEALSNGALKGLGYRYMQLDDGWQEAYGDWVANGKFSGGIAAVAEGVRRRGQVMGIWTAPFLVAAASELGRSAPDEWFVKDPITGERATDPVHLVFGPMYVLDARRRAVREHLREVFAGLYAAGVRYFKIDFLYAGGYAGTRAVRQGVRAIREAIGDSYLLACGAPLLPVVGLAEGCRIGRDTATPLFDFEVGAPKPTLLGDEIVEVGRNQAARHFLSGWFQLDPDVALVGGNLTLEQARSCVTICALSGGPFFASDDLVSLERERLELLTNPRVLQLVGGSPAVPDWDPRPADRPARVWRRGRTLAAFNWDDDECEVTVEIGPGVGSAIDLWSGEVLPAPQGRVGLRVPAQGVRLIEAGRG